MVSGSCISLDEWEDGDNCYPSDKLSWVYGEDRDTCCQHIEYSRKKNNRDEMALFYKTMPYHIHCKEKKPERSSKYKYGL